MLYGQRFYFCLDIVGKTWSCEDKARLLAHVRSHNALLWNLGAAFPVAFQADVDPAALPVPLAVAESEPAADRMRPETRAAFEACFRRHEEALRLLGD